MNQEIPLDAGGTLVHQPTTRSRPSAATCTLVTPAGATLATPTVTIDPVDTSVDTAADAGDTELVLDSVTGIVARRYYVLATASGQIAQVRVRQVRTSDSTVVLFSPLRFDVAVGDDFFGTRLTAPVTSGQAATLGEGYEARFSVVTPEGTQVYPVRWDVVRSAWPADLVTPADLEQYAGPLLTAELQGADSYGLAFLDEIETAEEDVKTDILEQGRRPSLFRGFGAFKKPVMERVLLNMAEQGRAIPAVDQNDPSSYREMRAQRYGQALSRAMSTTKDYDLDESGVSDASEARDRIRVLRLTR
jgi:hypothetical protein